MNYTGSNTPVRQNISPPIRSVTGKDSLSLALNALSQQLETIRLSSISIGPELFWPPTQTNQPYWPRLSHLKLGYKVYTPSGEWLLEKDPRARELLPNDFAAHTPSSNSDAEEIAPQDYIESYLTRSKPRDTLDSIYLAAGHAASKMPQMKTMKLKPAVPIIHGLYHILGHYPSHEFNYDRPSGTAAWTGSSEFHITERIHEVWDAVAKSHGHVQVTVAEGDGMVEIPEKDPRVSISHSRRLSGGWPHDSLPRPFLYTLYSLSIFPSTLRGSNYVCTYVQELARRS